MTLRDILPGWGCKITLSVTDNCVGDYNWLDFSIYEFIFTVAIILVIKWIIRCFFFIIGLIITDKTGDETTISNTLFKEKIEDFEDRDLEFDEDVFGLEEEPQKISKKEKNLLDNVDKEIETSIVNISRNGD